MWCFLSTFSTVEIPLLPCVFNHLRVLLQISRKKKRRCACQLRESAVEDLSALCFLCSLQVVSAFMVQRDVTSDGNSLLSQGADINHVDCQLRDWERKDPVKIHFTLKLLILSPLHLISFHSRLFYILCSLCSPHLSCLLFPIPPLSTHRFIRLVYPNFTSPPFYFFVSSSFLSFASSSSRLLLITLIFSIPFLSSSLLRTFFHIFNLYFYSHLLLTSLRFCHFCRLLRLTTLLSFHFLSFPPIQTLSVLLCLFLLPLHSFLLLCSEDLPLEYTSFSWHRQSSDIWFSWGSVC